MSGGFGDGAGGMGGQMDENQLMATVRMRTPRLCGHVGVHHCGCMWGRRDSCLPGNWCDADHSSTLSMTLRTLFIVTNRHPPQVPWLSSAAPIASSARGDDALLCDGPGKVLPKGECGLDSVVEPIKIHICGHYIKHGHLITSIFVQCIESPGASLSSSEERCLANCLDRYIDATRAVGQGLQSKAQ